MVGAERRAEAPHPGPLIARDFLEPLGLEAAAFAEQLRLDPAVLGAMLDGRASIDVPTAIRIARALQLPAERIMQMQLRYDFAAARRGPALEPAGPLRPPPAASFPAGALVGRLGRSADAGGGDSLFFREELGGRISGDDFAGLHALWHGDRLRVSDPSGTVLWIGPVLHDFDGRTLLPYVRVATWQGWFASGYPAELAMSADHARYLVRARRA